MGIMGMIKIWTQIYKSRTSIDTLQKIVVQNISQKKSVTAVHWKKWHSEVR